jgi:iron complex outermembrane recepter protein
MQKYRSPVWTRRDPSSGLRPSPLDQPLVNIRGALLGIGAALSLTGAPALAQSSAAAASDASTPSGGIEDVVVTARRTSESLQTTPISITAISQEALEQQQIVNPIDLQRITPNLVITADPSGTGFSLRGQVNSSANATTDQSVGYYVDGVYVARQMGGRFDLVDIERVEVLHGPQGTLFGRNTTGGAVSLITNQPTDEFEGSLLVGGGNYELFETSGVINVPLSEGIAVRVAARHADHSGYGENVFLDRDIGDANNDYIRGSIKIAPADNWRLTLSGDYGDQQSNGRISRLVHYQPALNLGQYLDRDYYDTSADVREFETVRMANGTATLEVDIGGLTLKSITGYRQLDSKLHSDQDTTPEPIFDFLTLTDIHQVSEELQLLGKTGPLDWIFGLFYFNEDGKEHFGVLQGLLDYNKHIDHRSWAPFAQANYQLTDALRATVGLRYTEDTRKLRTDNRFSTLGCLTDTDLLESPPSCVVHRDITQNYVSYTAGLDYQWTDNIFVYFRTGKANKSGGFNDTTARLEPYEPEEVTDYEIGAKQDFFERRLRVNVAAFMTYYKNMQRPFTESTTGRPTTFVQAIGKAELPGLELEIVAVPIDQLEVTASLGLLDPKYTEFEDSTGDRSDEPFTRVSEVSWNVGATYKAILPSGTLSLHADYGHQSSKNFFPSDFTHEPGYGLVNARATFELDKPNLEFALWGRNLTDEKYNVAKVDFFNGGGVVPEYPGDPRTYGASLNYKFGQ